jgi:DHA2 family metal-tetracycline-proton antiporter-like MFS transporter
MRFVHADRDMALPQDSDQKFILAIIACAAFMATLDSTIVNISLPTMAGWFHTDIGVVSWVVMAYLLVLSGLMLSCGRLGDIHGFRRVFLIGFAVFSLSSLFCGLSGSISLLIFFRILQGAGAAAVQALTPAMIARYLPEENRGWAFGILMTVVSLGIAGGPVLGGYITEFLGWHWIFFINVPIGILGLLFSFRFLPQDTLPENAARFDSAGAVLILLSLATLLFPLNQGLYHGWTSPVVIGSFLISILFWILFFMHERRFESPLIDMSLFTSRTYLLGNIAGMLIILSFAGTEFLLPFYFENIHGFSTDSTGILLAVPAAALMVAGPVAGRVSDRSGSRWIMAGAALIASLALFLYSLLSPASVLPFIIITLIIEGCAVGLFMPPNMSLILGSVEEERGGVASSVMMTLRNAGGMLGIALFGTIAMQFILMHGAEGYTGITPEPMMNGFSTAFLSGAAFCIIAAILSGIITKKKEFC